MSARRSRQARNLRARRCGNPAGCSQLGSHVVEDPVYGGRFLACDDHWPDLVAILWGMGAWVSGCPCAECVGVGVPS